MPEPPLRLSQYTLGRVHLRCASCRREGRYSVARLAVAYGAEITMAELLYHLTLRCKWLGPDDRRGFRPDARPACLATILRPPSPSEARRLPARPADVERIYGFARSMSYEPFKLEGEDANGTEKELALVSDLALAHELFEAAVRADAARPLALRQGARMIRRHQNPTKDPALPESSGARQGRSSA